MTILSSSEHCCVFRNENALPDWFATEHGSTISNGADAPGESLLSVNDVAGILGKGRGFVYELIASGELHPARLGERWRFSARDVRAYLERVGLEGGDRVNDSRPATTAADGQ
jgi:excisionase family DNA binding protein